MYQPAKVIETKIFARVPEELHWKGAATDWLAVRTWGRPGSFIESPNFDRNGNLFCVDIPYGRIFRVDKSGTFESVFQYDGEPNSLRFHRDGRIFIADAKRGILILDPSTWKIEPFVTRVGNEGLAGPNDLVFSSKGDLYFTDMGRSDLIRPVGRVVHVSPNGAANVVMENIPGPNGLVLNDDASALYVAVTRDNSVWRLNVRPDGSISKAGVYIHLSGGLGPDGMTIDSAGNLLVVHAGTGSVWVFDPTGEPLYRVKSCTDRITTNLTYGVDDPHMLYVTEALSGCILTARMPDPGRALFSHQ